jgi:hypothetical protein
MTLQRHHLLIVSLLLSSFVVSGQKPAIDFSSVDSFATTVRYEDDIYTLTAKLTNPYPEQLFKTRAIFRWITDNIRYDYRHYNRYNYKGREPKTFTCKEGKNCEAERVAWEMKYINRVLKKKKAIWAATRCFLKECVTSQVLLLKLLRDM